MLQNIIAGLDLVMQWSNLLTVLVGVSVGMVMGAIPGLTGTMAIALLVPFSIYLNPVAGIAGLVGLSKGANFGGSIPAILFNLPGTPQAMVTTFDGYPLAKQGKAGKALRMALYASTIGDTLSDFVLFFLAAPVAALALKIGPPEYTAIILFSLMIIAVAGTERVVEGLIAVGFGLLFAIVGTDPVTGTPRFTFGSLDLSSGLSLVPTMVGLLIVSEALIQIERMKRGAETKPESKEKENNGVSLESRISYNDHRVSWAEFKQCFPWIMSGVGIGSAIGSLPGIGATIASYLSYANAKRRSKHPELFGKGALEGVAAAEAANNACQGPNLIPLITLGIPGNVAAALLLGAFMIKGLLPGPLFMQQNAPMLYALFTVLILSNIVTFLFGSVFIRLARYSMAVPELVLYPGIMIFGSIGSYVFRNNIFDVFAMVFFGVFGYILIKYKIPLAPVIVAFILGKMFEERLRQALAISGGNISIFFTHPISLGFILLTIVSVVFLMKRKMN